MKEEGRNENRVEWKRERMEEERNKRTRNGRNRNIEKEWKI